MKAVVAVDGPRGSLLAEALQREGIEIVGVTASVAPAEFAADRLPELHDADLAAALSAADALVLQADRLSLTSALVGLCDRSGVRILPLCAEAVDAPLAGMFGLAAALPLDAEPWRIAEALASRAEPAVTTAAASARDEPRIMVVWGPPGAPGRSTIAIELAVELARGGRRVALVDADTHSPSVALQLGLADEGPGFAAACRQAERGELDVGELARIGVPLGRTGVDVLTGINRPSRWPELTDSRVTAALEVCREWADYIVVDVAAPLERDEEIVSDLDGPRRNAATLAALRAADLVVAVAAADPVGVSRFLRAHADLRATIGATPVAVVANRLRPGSLGIDARGQVRRTLERFGGVRDVWFVPWDARSTDAALLAGRPVAETAPKSPLTLAIRRFVGEALVPAPPVEPASRSPRRGRGRGIRRPSRTERSATGRASAEIAPR
ncbi:P-loop NTPase [Microbacterium sp. RU33B]|uniref:AAA family ATPase n=1 Tax=Microbacterium sp. RU33B TaxID=1907390 RepID=UPI00095C7975|nr:P-loop NTPase [Microbacterium sp. RU33B]SIT89107.1 MinD-like ATPase involved in chromosome partitioning or flagellar assembly [Microbacterium sp. RU33B]